MAFRYFPTRGREWLEAELQKLEEELASDKSLVGWNGPDASASKQKGNAGVMHRMRLVLHDLAIIYPTKYSASNQAATTTTARFRE